MGDTASRAYTPGQVADLFSVDVKTVARWADAGRLPYFVTPGGHRRFPAASVDKMLQPQGVAPVETEPGEPVVSG